MKNYLWKSTVDERTRGTCVKPFFTETDTKVPMRKAIEQNWLDRLLKRHRMKTVWVNKRPVRLNAMMRKTINCRCAMIPVVETEFQPERPHLVKDVF